jgi:zinc D-Ala-D-Ala dipeptidase
MKTSCAMNRLWSLQLILNLSIELSTSLPVMAMRKSFDSPLALSRQCVVVLTESWRSSEGTLQCFERDSTNSAWRRHGVVVPVVIGRNGLAWGDRKAGEPQKREGDLRSPAGAFRLSGAFGTEPKASTRLPYRQLTEDTIAVDDPESRFYNRIIEGRSVAKRDWRSAEKMGLNPLYRLGVFVDYNVELPSPGAGSCIFLHVWRGPTSPTAGCTALVEKHLAALIRWLDPAARPMLIQLPREQARLLRKDWGLP